VADYVPIGEASYTLRVKRAGATTTLVQGDRSLAGGEYYTAVAYGREGAVRLVVFSDNEEAPTSGYAKFRVFNAAADAGSLDVYVTEASTTLDESSPTTSLVAGGAVTGHVEIAQGSYRVRVTAANDKTDLRLDLPELALADQAIVTLLLQPGSGGVLVHALIVQQRGAVTVRKNDKARARLVAAATDNAGVSASVGGTSLNVNLRSPSVGAYTLVPAGTQAVNVSVNGSTTLGSSMPLTAGADYTLLVHGPGTAPDLKMLSDDNRPPTNTARAKLRLVHAVAGLDGGLTLAKDYVAVANDVPYASASTAAQVDAATDARIEVTSPLAASALYVNDDASIAAGGVYSVFMLGGSGAAVGVLRRDR
jgi:hypothetical protein